MSSPTKRPREHLVLNGRGELQRRGAAQVAAESLDFEDVVNRVSLAAAARTAQEEEQRHIYG